MMRYIVPFVLFLVLGVAVIVFFEGANVVNRARFAQLGSEFLHDETLLKV